VLIRGIIHWQCSGASVSTSWCRWLQLELYHKFKNAWPEGLLPAHPFRRAIGRMKRITFWDMTPCSPLSFNRRFGGTYRLHLQGRRNRFSKPASKQVASTLKMEAISSSETSGATQRTARRHIPEDDSLQHYILFIICMVRLCSTHLLWDIHVVSLYVIMILH
jgi:hypothetical protein